MYLTELTRPDARDPEEEKKILSSSCNRIKKGTESEKNWKIKRGKKCLLSISRNPFFSIRTSRSRKKMHLLQYVSGVFFFLALHSISIRFTRFQEICVFLVVHGSWENNMRLADRISGLHQYNLFPSRFRRRRRWPRSPSFSFFFLFLF